MKLLLSKSFSRNSLQRRLKSYFVSDVFNLPMDTVITVNGWIRIFQTLKRSTFIHLGDGLSPKMLQVVAATKDCPQDLCIGCALKVTGKLIKSIGPEQPIELQSSSIEVLGLVNYKQFPFHSGTYHNSLFLRRFQPLRAKSVNFSSYLRLRNVATKAVHAFFDAEHFVQIQTPLITSNDCEGAGETFIVSCPRGDAVFGDTTSRVAQEPDEEAEEVSPEDYEETGLEQYQEDTINASSTTPIPEGQYFADAAFLTVSGQLHLEAAAGGIAKVYSFGPVFRAEKTLSRLRLSEFYMIEAELAFTNNLSDVMSLAERLIKYIVASMLNNCSADLNICLAYHNPGEWEACISMLRQLCSCAAFPRITHEEAVNVLLSSGHKFATRPAYDLDLKRQHEDYLSKHFNGLPVFITHYPTCVKPFYMKRSAAQSQKVECFDLIAGNAGEICGGSLREGNYERMCEQLVSPSLANKLSWYMDLRRFGHSETGGFGIGFERLMQTLLGIRNIRDTILFPRRIGQSCA